MALVLGSYRRLPDAIIAGAKKCGTTTLLQLVNMHPSGRGVMDEVHYFDQYHHRGLDWYRMRMPKTNSSVLALVEKTPKYFVTRRAPKEIRDVGVYS